MNIYRKIVYEIILIIISLTLVCTISTNVQANYLYSYTGRDFNQRYNMGSGHTNLRGYFTTATPIGSTVLTNVSPINYDFTDGVMRWTNTSQPLAGYTLFQMSEDQDHNPLQWHIDLWLNFSTQGYTDLWHAGIDYDFTYPDNQITLDIVEHIYGMASLEKDSAFIWYMSNHPHGEWTPGQYYQVPIPPSILLFPCGLIGLWGWGRKKFQ
ncbi:MAG: hypothetical protein ABFD75_15200 [Smithella sp.]